MDVPFPLAAMEQRGRRDGTEAVLDNGYAGLDHRGCLLGSFIIIG